MWSCAALAAFLTAVDLAVNARYLHKKPSVPGLLAGLGTAELVCFLLSPVSWQLGFVIGLLGGLALILGIFERKQGVPAVYAGLFCIGAAAVCVPFCFAGDAWQLCFYVCLCLLLAIMGVPDLIRGRWCSEESRQARPEGLTFCAFLPLGNILLCLALLYPFAPISPGKAAVLFAVLTVDLLLLLLLQYLADRNKQLRRMNNMLQQWHAESRDYMNTIRSQRHDFNLHLHAISGLIGSAEYEECSAYVQKLVADAASVNDIMPVSDAVVGSMLYNMREEARKIGSDITYHITYDMSDLVCNGFECNKILGNLLQNAIDALQTPEDKAYGIHMKIFKRRGNTVATVENRFSGDPNQIATAFEAGRSSKQNHDGIGLTMVLRTVEKYGGRVYPEFEDERIRFVVNIPNKVTLKGEETL